MVVLLFCVGVVTLISGVIMTGYGIPVREFSFGNTLIISGIATVVGGLIIVALGVVVSQLRQIALAMGQSAIRESKRNESYESAPRGRIAEGPMQSPSNRAPLVREAYSPALHGRPTVTTAEAESARDAWMSGPLAPTLPNPERSSGATTAMR